MKERREHPNSPVRRPAGNYETPPNNDAFGVLEMDIEMTEGRTPESLFVFTCPICQTQWYAGADYQRWMVQVQAQAAAMGFKSMQILGPACEPCHAVMDVRRLIL